MTIRTKRLTAQELEAIASWKRKPCEYCQSENIEMRRAITSSGVTQYRWYCLGCGAIASKTRQNIPHWIIDIWHEAGKLPIDLLDIPLASDYTAQAVCCVCGKAGAELHHFAPQMLSDYFGGEWTQWPTAYLCKYHHDLWHSIVTPCDPHVRANAIAQDVLRKYYEAVGV
jgi:hypothetical protein